MSPELPDHLSVRALICSPQVVGTKLLSVLRGGKIEVGGTVR
jgi:hypothetical protein